MPNITEITEVIPIEFQIQPEVTIEDINLASSIILNKSLKVSRIKDEDKDDKIPYEDENIDFNAFFEEDEEDSETEDDYPEETESESEETERDSGDLFNHIDGVDTNESESEDTDVDTDNVDTLRLYLEANYEDVFEFTNFEFLAENIIKYANIIKKYNIPQKVKLNRINFFKEISC
jgi:hypothetical protein